MLDAVRTLHQYDVIHGYIKPEHFVVNDKGLRLPG